MKPTLLCCRNFAAILLLFISLHGFAQLNPFTLTVTPTPQTCLGNGSMSFATTGTTAGSTISYDVFLLPNLLIPVVSTSNTSVSSLSAGNYRVVATQALGALTNTALVNISIVNNIVPIQFSVVGSNVTCNNNGRITINVTGGTASRYEIISGPAIRPLQTSNVFLNLPPGIYRVRVFDACGEGFTRDVTLSQVNASINIGPSIFSGPLADCSTMLAQNEYASPTGINVIYPLTLTYTVFPPGGGAAITVPGSVTAGGNNGVATAQIPFYYNQQYSYNLTIRDGCGNVFTRNSNIVNQQISVEAEDKYPGCNGAQAILTPANFVGPLTVTFTQSPVGFNPVAAAPSHPVFNDLITYGGINNPLPEGDYTVQLLDACGHTATKTFTIDYPEVSPKSDISATCGSTMGGALISFDERLITHITIQQAPAGYVGTVPSDLSAGISANGTYVLTNVPQGLYTFYIIDSCGDTHTYSLTIEPTSSSGNLVYISRAGCQEGNGSLRLYGPVGTSFSSALITTAPAGFTQPLPYNITANLNGGQLYMNGLPAGQYTIQVTDQCNFTQSQIVTVLGYTVTTNNVDVIKHCGTFDINLQHTSTGSYTQSFWLQKLINPATGQWGHPGTGVPYYNGLPTAADSKVLSVNQMNANNEFTGRFRIIKIFYVFNNGDPVNEMCFKTLKEFDFGGGPEILDVNPFPCANGGVEAAVIVDGVPPFTYAITSRNDDTSFSVPEQSSNVFSGLTPGKYNFQVSDDCNNVRNKEFTINTQDPVAVTPSGFCEGQASSLSVPSYTYLSYQWYKVSNPSAILSTTSILNFGSYNSATDSGVYAVRVISQDITSCLNQTIQYTVDPNRVPNAGTDNTVTVCNTATGTTVNLTSQLGATFDNGGTWNDVDASGALDGSNFNTQGIAQGTYHFTYTVNGICSAIDVATITVAVNTVPQAPVITPAADVCEGATVQLITTTVADSYSWTGPNGFTSSLQNPLLTNTVAAQSGTYSLTATVNGCASPAATVSFTVMPLPFAGNDNTSTQCNPGTVENLFSYIGTGYTTGGTWTDIDASAALTGADFNTALVTAGTFRFRYSVTSPCGITDDATVTIRLNSTPAAPVVTPVPLACAGSTVQLMATSAISTATYSWTGPNGYISSAQNPVLTNVAVNQSGTYEVTVTANGCTSPPAQVNLAVSPLPNAGTNGADVLCNSGMVIDLATYLGTHDTGGTWTDIDGSGALASGNFTTMGVAAGVYHFKYDVTSLCGAADDAMVTITLNTIPGAPVVAPVAPACVGQDVQFTATAVSIPGISYSWTGPNGFTSSLQNPVITAATTAANGTYSLIVTTTGGCTSPAATVVVTLKELPDYTISGDAQLCAGQSTTLAVAPVNFSANDAAYSYAWYNGTTLLTETGPALSVNDFGTYTVAVNNGICTVAQPFSVSVATNPFDVDVIAGCENYRYIIRVENYSAIADVVSVNWAGPNGFTATGEWVDITAGAKGVYTATITQQGGCVASGRVTVDKPFCSIPKGVSPDGNQDNDTFDLSHLDVRHIKIFNRYGLEVYEKYDYIDEWHGQSDKGDLPTGTYFYVITLSQGQKVTGWVYLMRKV